MDYRPGGSEVAKKRKYRTISLPTGITDAIEELVEELGFWPSVGAFVREAALKMIREEWPRLGKGEEPPVKEDPMKGRKRGGS